MNILADFHHADLWWSLHLLANRLGAHLYRPYGMEWYDEAYFKLYGDLRKKDPTRWIAKQYLVDTLFEPFDHSGPIKMGRETYNGCKDYPLFNTLTLDQAKTTPIDVVICSVHENEEYFGRLREFYPNAKFIRQVGNDLDTIINEEIYPNLLSSAMAPYNVFQGHKVLYHQEFDRDLFKPEAPWLFGNLWSFQNDMEQFEDTWDFWINIKHKLRDFHFKSFGVGCEDGKIYPKQEYINTMLLASFIFQSKGPWEGYGHTIHNAICLGRPLIIKSADYAGKLAEPLLIKDKTYLEMDDELPEKIRFFSRPEQHADMYKACLQTFNEHVNFDKSFIQLKDFFEHLV